uniref:Uncharacterized protein n=1 Tax=Falco tinnunculus TaxID=100819 RepID=A0A8C4XJK9_FALTI
MLRHPQSKVFPHIQKELLVFRFVPVAPGPTLNSWFWWENIWMPVNVTWAHFVDRDGLVFPKPHQLYATIPYAFVLLIIRFLSERVEAFVLQTKPLLLFGPPLAHVYEADKS